MSSVSKSLVEFVSLWVRFCSQTNCNSSRNQTSNRLRNWNLLPDFYNVHTKRSDERFLEVQNVDLSWMTVLVSFKFDLSPARRWRFRLATCAKSSFPFYPTRLFYKVTFNLLFRFGLYSLMHVLFFSLNYLFMTTFICIVWTELHRNGQCAVLYRRSVNAPCDWWILFSSYLNSLFQ